MAHFGHRSVPVIGHGLNQYGHATIGIALINQFFNVITLTATSAARNRTLNGVLGHVRTQGFIHRCSQAWIVIDYTAAQPSCYRDLTNQFGVKLAALFVLSGLAVLDVGPLTVSCHICLPILVVPRRGSTAQCLLRRFRAGRVSSGDIDWPAQAYM